LCGTKVISESSIVKRRLLSIAAKVHLIRAFGHNELKKISDLIALLVLSQQ
jgi:hypothetical protein